MAVEYAGHSRIFSYYDEYASMDFLCKCGWKGPFSELAKEHYRELFDASCPRCDTRLVIVSFPTGDEVRKAARQGNKQAHAELESVRRREAFLERYDSMELKQASQLPDLEGGDLLFEWAPEERANERHVVIRLLPGGREVWRELEAWENWRHFLQVRRILRERYGSRFRGLQVDEGAGGYLFGDDISGIAALDKAIAEGAALMGSTDQGGSKGNKSPAIEVTTKRPGIPAQKAVRARRKRVSGKKAAAAKKAAATRKRQRHSLIR